MKPIAYLFAAALLLTGHSASAQPTPPPQPAPASQPAPPAPPAPAGTYGGACYGNSTCNQGLVCNAMRNQCLAPPTPPAPGQPAQPPQGPPPPPAPGQPYPAAPPPSAPAPYLGVSDAYLHHQGFMIGFGLGAATADCDDCNDSEGGVAFDFNVGGFVNPRLAVMFDASGWYDSENDVSLTLSGNTAAGQYWVSPKFWVKGGLGLSRFSVSFNGESDSESGLAVTAGAGFEIMQSGSFAIDVSGRLNYLTFDNTNFTVMGLTVGARWK